MFCSNCGVHQDEGSNFCTKCGFRTTPTSPIYASAEVPVYETCQVTVVKALGLYNFVAQAVSPKRGVYKASSSPVFNVDPNVTTLGLRHAHAQAQLNSLVKRLGKEGWEPAPNSGQTWWYDLRFRRRVDK